ncbi:hypothetical protein CYY_006078 [Polysphondylium violaceum]|uniref:RNA helicase n=1 Tax=Polysphondylium violaceum TaxID=133409 RepID=A0A8J4PU42_9MYCE|nr:hypothetical protein CYY_006078 [Polysphondylium violaceum]
MNQIFKFTTSKLLNKPFTLNNTTQLILSNYLYNSPSQHHNSNQCIKDKQQNNINRFYTTTTTTFNNNNSSSDNSDTTLKNDIFSINKQQQQQQQSFNYSKQVIQALKELNITEPTPIQKKIIKAFDKSKSTTPNDIFILDETGTGKSYAIVCEIVDRYYQYLKSNTNQSTTTTNSATQEETTGAKTNVQPKYLLISPSRELSWQLAKWIRDLLIKLPGVKESDLSKIQLAVGGIPTEVLKQTLEIESPDIIIGTPKVLYELMITGNLGIEQLDLLFIDEADHIFQPLKLHAIEKEKKIRKAHPLPSHLLFNEIKRQCRENNQIERDDDPIDAQQLLKMKLANKHQQQQQQQPPIKKYKKTARQFQSVFTSATLTSVTRRLIISGDWINKNFDLISIDKSNISNSSSNSSQNSNNVLDRLEYYFISVDSEKDILNGVVDVWKHLKPKLAFGIIANDANITNVVEQLSKRNINTKPLVSMMDFENFNICHWTDSNTKDSIKSLINQDALDKNRLLKKDLKEKQKKREIETRLKNLSQPTKKQDDDEYDVQENQRFYQKDKESILYIAKEDAIRGIDIAQVSHVFILNVPVNTNNFLHMIGRTARMGNKGNIVSIYHPALSSKYNSTMKSLNIPFEEESLY